MAVPRRWTWRAAKTICIHDLPTGDILHAVGTIIYSTPTHRDCAQLTDCYRACLRLVSVQDIDSMAFCCINTGKFRFSRHANGIAICADEAFLTKHSAIQVIFAFINACWAVGQALGPNGE